MIGFVETLSSLGAVRLDDIEKIDDAKANEHGVNLHRVRVRGGGSFETFDHERGGLMRRPVQLIPAEPSTKIIRADEHGVYMRTRVIAWALWLDGEVRPVTRMGSTTAMGEASTTSLPTGRLRPLAKERALRVRGRR